MLANFEQSPFVAVASQNFSKLEGTRIALQKIADYGHLPNYEVRGAPIDSGVSAQPYGHEETKQGALNRLRGLKVAFPYARFWVSIESGAEVRGEKTNDNYELWEIGYVVVECALTNRQSLVNTLSFKVPDGVTKLMREGYEMGDAANIHYGVTNSKEIGVVGLISKGSLERTDLATPALILAFSQCIFP